ncbi:MAG: hypothetical protein KME29_33185 [Calothrix sp. FI2-JRJ7]|nr:hypothetical protein [Calothrix sp. FI2-JRJ7]
MSLFVIGACDRTWCRDFNQPQKCLRMAPNLLDTGGAVTLIWRLKA